MSNYPPTPPNFGGSAHNSTQWPTALPHNSPFHLNTSPVYQQLQSGPRNFMDYPTGNEGNYHTNPPLPGLGTPGATGPLPLAPFPFMAPFPATQLPAPTHSSMPLDSAPNSTLSNYPPASTFQAHNKGDSHLTTSSRSTDDLDREEGELTDREGVMSTRPTMMPQDSRELRGLAQTKAAQADLGGDQFSELEEGETSSVHSRSSSRESGSPYNPPLSMDASPVIPPSAIHYKPHLPSKPSSANTPENTTPLSSINHGLSNGKRSPAQLRVQAQGALLSLAPHNIRYHELVGEGINPMVLKRLYEEVGIKVTSPRPDTTACSSVEHGPPTTQSRPVETTPAQEQVTRISNSNTVPKEITPPSGLVGSATNQVSPRLEKSKPMERKEVIARMLAAKAAKSSGSSTSSQAANVTKEPIPETTTSINIENGLVSSSSEDSAKEKEVRVREKNKAKTELARQRIEQLKKQGLTRSQQKTQTDSFPLDKPHPSVKIGETADTPSNTAAILHPLPERPPEPETQESRIPGLFMAESGPVISDDSFVSPAQGLMVDPTPQPRINQRKRPRASDFDEPIPLPKKPLGNGTSHFPEDRLIIDISDDELYEDEDDEMEIDDYPEDKSQDDMSFAPEQSLRPLLPQRSLTSSSQPFSTSATPQLPRNNDQEDLRRRDMEILAMHKRIAELEQRKKAKLVASCTQSPHALDSSASTPLSIAAIDIDNSNASLDVATTTEGLEADSEPLAAPKGTGLPPLVSPSSKVKELECVRAKILRKREIESGIPALDAELERSEAKLGYLKDEQGLVLLEIARGKEGRQQLLHELNNLDLELNGVTLEEVEEELCKARADEQRQAIDKASIIDQNESTIDKSQTPATFDIQQRTAPTIEDLVNANAVTTSAPGSVSSHPDNEMDEGEPSSDSDSSMSSSESEGSAMNESNDSDSDRDSEGSGSDQDASGRKTPASGLIISENQEGVDDIKPDNSGGLGAANPSHPLPERPRFTDKGNEADLVLDTRQQEFEEHGNEPDESSDSEAYEPPEPEAASSPPGSDYTPSFIPPSHGLVDDAKDISQPPTDQPRNGGELLTGMVQEVDTIDHPPIDILENAPPQEGSEHRFTPYISPLKNFTGYRYHPNYTEGATDGYRSLTYSHNIDTMKYLCPFESAGGVCNDRSCEFQHFRDMSLSDDKILIEMGSVREGKTPEERDTYTAGLKEIINDMRRDKVKDFNTVATEIAAYRRRFLQDPSRILPL
ncbi:hypothetical protein FE257_006464 [Aspergillus nanangensis]|uniref:Putative zinc-finger domain-containing protein n=1 Tax=Aspergillus nanangensis TaxID=2582783 RepID=A0AAD4CY25_ASPNN|nr:hypothetical protein FE257_006464 [Aspergillus nanangensis]